MDRLDPLDAAMMTTEVLVSALGTGFQVGAVLILSPPEDAGPGYVDELYREALAATDPLDPRLRRYPHCGTDTGGIWVWRDAHTVEMSHHFARMTMPPGVGRDEFWRLIGDLHGERIDRSRPMWMSHLIDGLDGGRFALYVKVHHTVMDGVAGMQMLGDALSADPKRRSMRAFFAAQHDESTAAATAAAGLSPNPFTLVRSLVGAATATATLAERVVAGEVSNVLASLTTDTTVAPVAAPYTRFNGRIGPKRAVAARSCSKGRIRAVQDATGVTGNDVVTAVVAGVLRGWLLDHDELPEQSLVAVCPITVRGHGHGSDDRHGNMLGAWLCPLGTNLSEPAERLDLIHRSMAEGKHQVASRGSGASMLLLAASIVPTVLESMLPFASKLRTGYNVQISNVPGPRVEMYWNGAHIEEIYPVAAVGDGNGLNVTVCSYADRICFGYLAGSDIMPDVDTLIPLTERCLAELEAAVGVKP